MTVTQIEASLVGMRLAAYLVDQQLKTFSILSQAMTRSLAMGTLGVVAPSPDAPPTAAKPVTARTGVKPNPKVKSADAPASRSAITKTKTAKPVKPARKTKTASRSASRPPIARKTTQKAALVAAPAPAPVAPKPTAAATGEKTATPQTDRPAAKRPRQPAKPPAMPEPRPMTTDAKPSDPKQKD